MPEEATRISTREVPPEENSPRDSTTSGPTREVDDSQALVVRERPNVEYGPSLDLQLRDTVTRALNQRDIFWQEEVERREAMWREQLEEIEIEWSKKLEKKEQECDDHVGYIIEESTKRAQEAVEEASNAKAARIIQSMTINQGQTSPDVRSTSGRLSAWLTGQMQNPHVCFSTDAPIIEVLADIPNRIRAYRHKRAVPPIRNPIHKR